MRGSRTLTDLPVELLYELYLLALSPSLPLASRYIYTAIKAASAVLHAQYLLGRHTPAFCRSKEGIVCISGAFLTRVLRYPICTLPVLEVLSRLVANVPTPLTISDAGLKDTFQLPKRIFRSLDRSISSSTAYGPNSDPLPLLRFLWQKGSSPSAITTKGQLIPFMKPSANSYMGYPLFRAVCARFPSLIQFLLDHEADPKLQDYAAVKTAILDRDLETVKLLVEREPEYRSGSSKRRRRSDRFTINTALLDLAIKTDARKIVEYFIIEKGSVPDMKSLRHI